MWDLAWHVFYTKVINFTAALSNAAMHGTAQCPVMGHWLVIFGVGAVNPHPWAVADAANPPRKRRSPSHHRFYTKMINFTVLPSIFQLCIRHHKLN